MNVSQQADAAFMMELKQQDPKRYKNLMHNMRADVPANAEKIPEDQALTNFMLGLPTGQWRFKVVAGLPAPAVNPVTDIQAFKTAEIRRKLKTRTKQARAARQRQAA